MHVNRKPRRRHSEEFKARVVAACSAPGASVAAVAQSFGVNDNLVHQWRRGRGFSVDSRAAIAPASATACAPEFVALAMPATLPATVELPCALAAPVHAEKIQLELKRGTLAVSVAWPISAAADCAAWLREVLR